MSIEEFKYVPTAFSIVDKELLNVIIKLNDFYVL